MAVGAVLYHAAIPDATMPEFHPENPGQIIPNRRQTSANIGAKTFSAPPRRTETFSASHRARRLSVCVCVARQYAGDAAATSPAVPKGAWLRPRPARQSRDCLRGRVHRQASLLRRLARLPAAASPARHVWSAPSFVWGGLCGSLGYRSRLRRKARHASAGDGADATGGIPTKRSALVSADGCRAREERRMRGWRSETPHRNAARPCQPWRTTRPQPSGLRAEERPAMRPCPNAIS